MKVHGNWLLGRWFISSGARPSGRASSWMVGNHKDSPHLVFKGRLVKTPSQSAVFLLAILIIFVCENMSSKSSNPIQVANMWVLGILMFAGATFVYNSPKSKWPWFSSGEGSSNRWGKPFRGNQVLFSQSHALFGHIYPIVLSFELQNPCLPSQIQVSRLVEGAKIAASSNDAIIKVDGFLKSQNVSWRRRRHWKHVERKHSPIPQLSLHDSSRTHYVCFGGLHQLSTLTGLPQLNLYEFRRISYKVSKTLTLPENIAPEILAVRKWLSS